MELKRRTFVLIVAAAVVVSALATLIASESIRSPAEVAARKAPPTPSPILVPVVRQVLATKIVTRGTAHYGSPRRLSVTRSALKTAPRVITSLPRSGSIVREGDVLLTISGRPVFILRGARPSYRDLGPGMSGPDVGQLERALRRSGLDPGSVDGLYDGGTAAAVERLYRRHGFSPVVATDAQLAPARPREAGLVPGASASGGVQLPADEAIFVPATPLRVAELPRSSRVARSGQLLTVTDANVDIDAFVPVEQAGRIRKHAKVLIDEPALGIHSSGTVSEVAGRPGTHGADGFHVFFGVAVHKPPKNLVGASVRLSLPIRSTKKAELTVPLSAVSLAPGGGARVQRVVGNDEFEFVPVKTGLAADGSISVTPTRGTLTESDRVVVGFRRNPRAGAR